MKVWKGFIRRNKGWLGLFTGMTASHLFYLYLMRAENRIDLYAESRAWNETEVYALYGGLFFLGAFLGIMFLIVTVMLIFYKQISEGYEDKERYVIMEKVGMSSEDFWRC